MLLLQRHGIKVGWVSNRASSATRQRSEELKMDFLFQAKGSKVSAIESILAEAKVSWEEVCFMGDDVVDLGALQRAGVAVAVANAIAEVKAVADYVTKAEGGQGAVREVVTLLLQSQNKWEQIIREHSA